MDLPCCCRATVPQTTGNASANLFKPSCHVTLPLTLHPPRGSFWPTKLRQVVRSPSDICCMRHHGKWGMEWHGMGFPAKSLPQQIPSVWPNEIGFRSEPQWRGKHRKRNCIKYKSWLEGNVIKIVYFSPANVYLSTSIFLLVWAGP